MARLNNKVLFFTTSPRTPAKMIPEIRLLCDKFGGKPWNKNIQEQFIDKLAESSFLKAKVHHQIKHLVLAIESIAHLKH